MAFCANCGAQAPGKFCPNCGATITAAGPAPGAPAGPDPGASYSPPPGYQAAPPVAGSGLAENVAGALCYLAGFVTGILFLALAPYNQNPRIRFNAFQSIFFNVAWIALWIVFGIVGTAMAFTLSTVFWMIHLLGTLIGLCFLVVWIILMVKAYNNSPLVLPIIGPMAQKQAGN
jgi:uncharacterized membrane protein